MAVRNEVASTKTCRRCGETKSLDAFANHRRNADGKQYECRECGRARYLANRESVLERSRQHYAANRDRYRAVRAAHYQDHKDEYEARRKAWYSQNKERHREMVRAWRAANPDRERENVRAWRAQNRDRLRELGRLAYAANPEKFIEAAARRRAQIASVTIGAVDLNALWTDACGICGESLDRDLRYPDPMSKSLDHVIPLSRGGSHTQGNLQWSHLFCNVSKGASLPDERAEVA